MGEEVVRMVELGECIVISHVIWVPVGDEWLATYAAARFDRRASRRPTIHHINLELRVSDRRVRAFSDRWPVWGKAGDFIVHRRPRKRSVEPLALVSTRHTIRSGTS